MTCHREETIEVNGFPIHYVRHGNGEHVVFPLPGSRATGRSDFFEIIGLFDKAKYTLILWDPIGRGKSRFSDRRNFIYNKEFCDFEAKTAGDFLDKLGIKRYSLIGGCYGGEIAVRIAATRKECVNKVILWGVRPYVTEEDCIRIDKAAAKFNADLVESKKGIEIRERLIDANGGEEHTKYLFNALAQGNWDCFRNDNGNICKDLLPEVEAEVLVVHGDLDTICTLEHFTYMTEHLKRAKVHRFPNGGHILQIRFPRELYDVIDKFLQSTQSNAKL